MLLDTSPRDEGDQFGPKAAFHDPKLHRFTTICRFVHPLASSDIRSFVLMHGEKIARIKGIAQVDGDWAEVQAVRGDLRITPFSGTVPRQGRLVFISNKLYQTELIKVVSDVFGTHVDATV
jgi:G3E family GTPase